MQPALSILAAGCISCLIFNSRKHHFLTYSLAMCLQWAVNWFYRMKYNQDWSICWNLFRQQKLDSYILEIASENCSTVTILPLFIILQMMDFCVTTRRVCKTVWRLTFSPAAATSCLSDVRVTWWECCGWGRLFNSLSSLTKIWWPFAQQLSSLAERTLSNIKVRVPWCTLITALNTLVS